MIGSEAAELLLRGAAVGALSVWALGFATSRASPSLRVAGTLFCVAALGFALNEDPAARTAIGLLTYPLWLLSVAAAGYFWLLVVTLFEDRKLTGSYFLVPAALTVTGLAAYLNPQAAQTQIWIAHHLLEVAIAVHALSLIARSWRDDLVEARRRLRGPIMAAATLFVLVWAGLELSQIAFDDTADVDLWVSGALALMSVAAAATFLETRVVLLGAAARPQSQTSPSVIAEADPNADIRDRVGRLMNINEIWRREGLTVAALAEAAAVPEYRLRRFINDDLGHRNFSSFVNEKRIEAARRALADPARARQTIAAIAFDLGFGSLGPFNRAFREVTGMTPTQFRAQETGKRLAESRNSSPIVEKGETQRP